MAEKIAPEARSAAARIADALDADVVFFNGEIEPDSGHRLVHLLNSRRRRANALLTLVTPGGDPDAAYRIARTFQLKYKRLFLFVPGWCKSAGTLIAIGAHELFVGDCGELGPLDIQLSKTDELWEMSSGLTVDAAISTLEQTAFKMFETYLFDIKRKSAGLITFRTASEIAGNLTVRLLEPIYSQIDPLKIGETGRAMKVTRNYGLRLNARSKILRGPKSLDFLVSSYPSHSFVIDRDEAGVLFTTVKEPSAEMAALAECLGGCAILPIKMNEDSSPFVDFLVEEPKAPKPVGVETRHVRKTGRKNGPAPAVRRSDPRDSRGAAQGKAPPHKPSTGARRNGAGTGNGRAGAA